MSDYSPNDAFGVFLSVMMGDGYPTFRAKNRSLADKAVAVLEEERPMTLRQLYYRLISAGVLQNKKAEYHRLSKVMTRLREAEVVPRTWIVDHVRATLKPSSWTGLADFGDTVRNAYRKDFWARLPDHVEMIVEKDAVAGTIQPITAKYDIALRVCRGYASVSFAGEIADEWTNIKKPIHACYLGDFDPSGFDIERDLKEKLIKYSGRDDVQWHRLAIMPEDFEEFNMIPLPVKRSDRRAQSFIEQHGHACAELDALPPSELRERVEGAILGHVDMEEWSRLQEIEKIEKETMKASVTGWGQKENLVSHSQEGSW